MSTTEFLKDYGTYYQQVLEKFSKTRIVAIDQAIQDGYENQEDIDYMDEVASYFYEISGEQLDCMIYDCFMDFCK
jgi:hypothetical protein